jgi:hypothetical protein
MAQNKLATRPRKLTIVEMNTTQKQFTLAGVSLKIQFPISFFVVATTTLILGACAKAPVSAAGAPASPQRGYISGTVTREDGQPVPSFTVHYSGFEDSKLADTANNGGLSETIDATIAGHDGRFAIKVPPGAYRASAYVTYRYREREYNLQCEPVNLPARHDFDGLGLDKLGDGLVRSFVLKLSGKKDGAAEDSETLYRNAYHGGRVDLDCRQVEGILGGGNTLTKALRDAYPRESQIAVTLTPQGPLVDGSTGQPFTAKLPLGNDGRWTFCLRGVPPGIFAASAVLTTPAGETVPLRVSLTPAKTILKGAGQYDKVVVDWRPSTIVDFMPNDLGPQPRFGVKPMTLYLGQ